jgi:hypothetical protein
MISITGLLLTGLIAWPAAAAPSAWPIFHHDPQHTGVGQAQAVAAGQKKWSTDLESPVNTAPVLSADGKLVYVGCQEKKVRA